jgi:hypothetical protein
MHEVCDSKIRSGKKFLRQKKEIFTSSKRLSASIRRVPVASAPMEVRASFPHHRKQPRDRVFDALLSSKYLA